MATCAYHTANFCCIEDASEFESIENDAFMAYWWCFLDIVDCPVQEITCAGNTDADSAVAADDDAEDGEVDVDSTERSSNNAAFTASTANAGPASTAALVAFSSAFLFILPLLNTRYHG